MSTNMATVPRASECKRDVIYQRDRRGLAALRISAKLGAAALALAMVAAVGLTVIAVL